MNHFEEIGLRYDFKIVAFFNELFGQFQFAALKSFAKFAVFEAVYYQIVCFATNVNWLGYTTDVGNYLLRVFS